MGNCFSAKYIMQICYFIMCIIHCDSIWLSLHLKSAACVIALWKGIALHYYATAYFFASIHWLRTNTCFSAPLKITFANSLECSCNFVFSQKKFVCNYLFRSEWRARMLFWNSLFEMVPEDNIELNARFNARLFDDFSSVKNF